MHCVKLSDWNQLIQTNNPLTMHRRGGFHRASSVIPTAETELIALSFHWNKHEHNQYVNTYRDRSFDALRELGQNRPQS